MSIKNTCHNKFVGAHGETIALEYLKSRGYRFVERNVKIGYSEIDLICTYQSKHVFIEVKSRVGNSDYAEAEYSITKAKLRSLKRGICNYSCLNKIALNSIALDLIVLIFEYDLKRYEIKHYRDIF